MSLDKLVNQLIEAARNEERAAKAQPLYQFRIIRKAGDLIKPCQQRAAHHRDREKFYTGELEKAEKKLRDEGVSVDVTDMATGISYGHTGTVVSGAMVGTSQLQAKIDQTLLDAVKRAKSSMIDHREKAEKYEKFARAFGCCPGLEVELTVDEVHFFRLEGEVRA